MLLGCVFLLVTWSSWFVDGQITLEGPKCGQIRCKVTEYCSVADRTCAQCSVACNQSSHNYEELICKEFCQDYLHDLRYVLRNESGNNNGDLRSTVDRLSQMLTVTLILVCFMLIVLAGFLLFQFYRWKDKKNITLASLKMKLFGKKSNQENTPAKSNNAIALDGKKGELRLDITTPRSQSEHSPVTVTTSISRRPAEDSTLDYAYDNPAMTSSR